MNIYLYELKSLRKSTIIWTASIVALAALFLTIYPSMGSQVGDLKALLSGYPPALRAMIGINLDIITSFLGFYAMIFMFVVLTGACQAMIVGTSILSKETRDRTADFLLAKPVSRTAVVTAKLSAAVTVILITDIVYYAASVLIATLSGAVYDGKLFLLITLMLPFIQLIFLSLGACVSVFFNKLKSVLPLSLGTVFGFYFIGALIASGKNVTWERYISPFRYYDVVYIIKNGGYELSYILVGLAVIVAAIAVCFIVYRKKDIHAVS
jgi:ABC-2 type transport system permease protein